VAQRIQSLADALAVVSNASSSVATGKGEQSKPTSEVLPVLYDELRQLAARKLAREVPGQTLQATALVHEAWLRLSTGRERPWANERHFFAAAAEAMRRILVDRGRRRKSLKQGRQFQRVELGDLEIASPIADADLLALDEALEELTTVDGPAAELVKLRFFAGLSHQEAARLLGMSRSGADRAWVFARAWLYHQIRPEGEP
jgi:RNA polymerase sigma factor (TIGR02999 family)